MTSAQRRPVDRAGYPPPALTAAVLALFAVVLAVCAVVAIGETTARAFTSYTPVEATVVDERTEEALVADRRGSNRVPFRVVSVELPDGIRAEMHSDDLVVGATATVYRGDSGAVFETPPARPTVLEWALCAAIVAAAVVLAVFSVRCMLALRAPA
ncbi:hypothetical protein GCM10009747_01120 [Agromyces humatus]|uniref:DUF3592 domain-containing protein n=2 Tax=Agromyces humatus TaxID=279573 RepID=A0ABN2K3T1_9MICO